MESIIILDMDTILFGDTTGNLQSVQYQARNQIQIHPVSKMTCIYVDLNFLLNRQKSEFLKYFLNMFLSRNVKGNFL